MAVHIEQIPFSTHLGMQLQSAGEGRSSCTVPLRPEHLNSNGVAHGGVTFSLSDTCMGQALMSVLARGERAVTVETKMNYLRPGSGGLLRSESQVVHRGRSLANVECRIWAGERIVATANGTFAILQAPNDAAA
ncbi:PaaI family thioesterase [Variovorax rhizosphaerae]|uniref:PaaI family thioesterase n=1 Tax=Variovorax rhizosphaerae TaxID=1836200 RepID=A0ABU8WUP8_9BURK